MFRSLYAHPPSLTTTSRSLARQKASTLSGPKSAIPAPRGEACVPLTTSEAVGSDHKISLSSCPSGSSAD